MIHWLQPDYSWTPVHPGRPEGKPEGDHDWPAVTIVTAFHNTGAVFLETVESVLRQTFVNWEWLIVDDGSNDRESLLILEDVGKMRSGIRVISQKVSRGPGAARNRGIREARGEYLFNLDSDDLVEPTAIEKLVWFLHCRPGVMMAKGWEAGFGAREYLSLASFGRGLKTLDENGIQPNCLFRKTVFERAGLFDESIRDGLEDWEFFLRCAAGGIWGADLPEILHWYRTHAEPDKKWLNFGGIAKGVFRAWLEAKYARLWRGEFPTIRANANWEHAGVETGRPRPKNVLTGSGRRHVTFLLPHMEMGGADKFNLDLIGMLVREHGWAVSLICTLDSGNRWITEFSKLCSDIFVLKNFIPTTAYADFIDYFLESRGSEVLCVSNSSLGYQLLPRIREHRPQMAVVDYNHMDEDYKAGCYPRYSVMYRDYLDRSITSSHQLAGWMREAGHDPEKLHVVHTNCDTELWDAERFNRPQILSKLGIGEGKSVILYAARICAQKQPMVFARTVELLAGSGRDFAVLVAGDGPDEAALIRRIQESGLSEKVHFAGAQTSEGIRELMAASDILFLPSEREGIALVIFEAMAMGVVPVTADVGGQRELVTRDCGFLVARSDNQKEATDYAAVLSGLVDDRDRLRSLGKRCRERILEGFSLDSMGRMLTAHFQACVELRAREPFQSLMKPRQVETHTIEVLYQHRLERHLEADESERSRLGNFGGGRVWFEVFYSKDEMYFAEQCVRESIATGEVVEVSMEIANAFSPLRLCVHPSDRAGLIFLHELSVYQKTETGDIALYWDWSRGGWNVIATGALLRVRTVQERGENPAVILAYSHDPQIDLPPFVAATPGCSWIVRCRLRVETDLSRMHGEVDPMFAMNAPQKVDQRTGFQKWRRRVFDKMTRRGNGI